MTLITLTINGRVPHISILRCGHRPKDDRFPLPTRKDRHPERSCSAFLRAAQSKDPNTLHITKTAQTISTKNPFAFAAAVAFAIASRYAKASALALSSQQNKRGFSPWGMLSYPSHEATA